MNNDLRPVKSGKVRDIYDDGDNFVLVASDRISAFDCILPTPIQGKGKILTALSAFWFARTQDIVKNHLISTNLEDFSPQLQREDWRGRAMLVQRAQVAPIECVVRGYLAGSGWSEYQKSGGVCGVALPEKLRESDKLPQPIFTPTTKADAGHDEPIDFDQVIRLCGLENAMKLREVSLALYSFAADYASTRGVIIADTKFEFGFLDDGAMILVDEALTPDSSRFWDAREYSPGRAQNSFDKQFVRDYLSGLHWDKTLPAPALPEEIVQRTRAKYEEAYSRITGEKWGN